VHGVTHPEDLECSRDINPFVVPISKLKKNRFLDFLKSNDFKNVK